MLLQGGGPVDPGRLDDLVGHALQTRQDDQHGERQQVPDGVHDDENPVGPHVGEPEDLGSGEAGDRVVGDSAEVGVEQPRERGGADHVGQHVRHQQDAEHDRAHPAELVDQGGDDVPEHQHHRGHDHRQHHGEGDGPQEPGVTQGGRVVLQPDEDAGLSVLDLLEAPLDRPEHGDQQQAEHHDHAGSDQQGELTPAHHSPPCVG